MLKIIGIEIIAALALLLWYILLCIKDKLVAYRRHKFMNFSEEMAKSMEEVIKNAADS